MGDADRALPFPDASFDVVVAGELLEHLRWPALFVAEARRVLRPGGTFVGSVPNSFRLKNRLLFLLGRSPIDDPTQLRMFSPGEVATLVHEFEELRLDFVSSRFIRINARLSANVIVFSCRKPG